MALSSSFRGISFDTNQDTSRVHRTGGVEPTSHPLKMQTYPPLIRGLNILGSSPRPTQSNNLPLTGFYNQMKGIIVWRKAQYLVNILLPPPFLFFPIKRPQFQPSPFYNLVILSLRVWQKRQNILARYRLSPIFK
jgi:hypothetical protein